MATKRKRPKYRGRIRVVVSRNVSELMPERFPHHGDKVKALARAAGISRSTVQRVVNASLGASIDNVEAIAMALGVMPHELLIAEKRR
jgi:AraC-like DNA-binding protein